MGSRWRELYLVILSAGTISSACGVAHDSMPHASEASRSDSSPSSANSLPNTESPPRFLSETGLFVRGTFAAGIASPNHAYSPRYPLWSDGTAKERWVYLPPDSMIDTGDMDNWVYPQGTIVWKEFSANGQRLETRMLAKTRAGIGHDAWTFSTYKWREDSSDADLVPDAGETRVHGTDHDIPSKQQCITCHGGAKDVVLGFTALQLSHAPTTDGALDLAKLVSDAGLTKPPADEPKIAGNPQDREVLGYMHGNCGHCHNSKGVAAATKLYLRHEGLTRTLWEEPAYSTTANRENRLLPGRPDASTIVSRSEATDSLRMPSMATRVVNIEFTTKLRAWIEALPK